MSFEEQLALFSGLEVLIAPAGAGLSNMIFMKSSSTVICFSNERISGPFYPHLASIIGLYYYDVGGTAIHPSEPLINQSFIINPSDLRQTLDEIFQKN